MANERTGQPIPSDFFYFAIARAGFVSFGNCQQRHVRYNQQEQQRKTAMTEGDYILGKKPDREIPADKIGRLELPEEDRLAGHGAEASGRNSPFWVKCWSCHQFLTRPLSPPSEQAYTCANCGAVNTI
jgi:hypothetical protein